MRRTAVALAALVAITMSACSIQTDSAPRDVPADKERELRQAEPEAQGGAATGNERIYLVASGDGQQVRTVARDTDGTPAGLLRVLLEGPNDSERAEGMVSEIPDNVALNSVVVRGDVVNVDITTGIRDLAQSDLVLAIGQIVYTASQLVDDGTGKVLIRVNGDAQSWPDASQRERSGPLTIYDFYGMAESSQPDYPQRPPQPEPAAPTATTSTTTSTTVPATSTSAPASTG